MRAPSARHQPRIDAEAWADPSRTRNTVWGLLLALALVGPWWVELCGVPNDKQWEILRAIVEGIPRFGGGVPKVPARFGIKARLRAGDGKPEEPEPDVPPLRVGNPVLRRGRIRRSAGVLRTATATWP